MEAIECSIDKTGFLVFSTLVTLDVSVIDTGDEFFLFCQSRNSSVGETTCRPCQPSPPDVSIE